MAIGVLGLCSRRRGLLRSLGGEAAIGLGGFATWKSSPAPRFCGGGLGTPIFAPPIKHLISLYQYPRYPKHFPCVWFVPYTWQESPLAILRCPFPRVLCWKVEPNTWIMPEYDSSLDLLVLAEPEPLRAFAKGNESLVRIRTERIRRYFPPAKEGRIRRSPKALAIMCLGR